VLGAPKAIVFLLGWLADARFASSSRRSRAPSEIVMAGSARRKRGAEGAALDQKS
jgi:hypothetical protein